MENLEFLLARKRASSPVEIVRDLVKERIELFIGIHGIIFGEHTADMMTHIYAYDKKKAALAMVERLIEIYASLRYFVP
ncbi:hypothetical protein KW799_00855 [Candidatus Parcubacteria bacterium]|nr:hypothetical protein [Candidatus Parcubacteria bacterium]